MTPEELLKHLRSKDKFDYGLMPPPIDAQEGLNVLIQHFLGVDWYVINPMSQKQVNTEAICNILGNYPRKAR